MTVSPCSQALYLSLACSYSACGPSSSPRMNDFRRGRRWDPDVPLLLGCTQSRLKQVTSSGRFRVRCETGLPVPFPRDRLPRRGWLGRRSRRASTRCWSRRPERARLWPGSWRSSTGCSGSTPRARSRLVCAAFTSPHCGVWATTLSVTCRFHSAESSTVSKSAAAQSASACGRATLRPLSAASSGTSRRTS